MPGLGVIKEQDRAARGGGSLQARSYFSGLFGWNACVGVAALQQHCRVLRALTDPFVNQPFRPSDKVIEYVLFLVERSGAVPFFAELLTRG